MKKAVTLINPKGESKDLTNVELYEMKTKFVKSKAFIEWSNRRNISGYINSGKECRISITAVDMFLIESGYKIIKNH